MTDLISSFKLTLKKYGMIIPGDRVLVAVSGGPDSVALLYLLHTVAKEWNLDLAIGHLNHMVRGKDSDRDADFVAQLGSDLDVPVFGDRIDVIRERAVLKTSFQETARILRYGFLADTLKKMGGNKIALGHTADDQVETVLMNLLRGSGALGISGIPPIRDPYFRPLIQNFRTEIIRFLKKGKISFRTDVSNQDRRYLRNRVRLDLIPKFVQEYNANFQTHLLEMAEILRDENTLLEEIAQQKFQLCMIKGEPGIHLSMDLNRFKLEPSGLRKRLIRKAIQWVKGDLRRVTTGHVRSVDHLALISIPGKTLHLPGLVIVDRLPNELKFGRNYRNNSQILINEEDESIHLQIPGATLSSKSGILFQAQILDSLELPFETVLSDEAYLDFDKTGKNLRFRYFQKGDRFMPLGMTGTKKLKSFFIDAKVALRKRHRIPLLTSSKDNIIWIYGHRISNFYKVTPTTRRVLYIKGYLKDADGS